MIYINQFFSNFYNQLRKIYLNSYIYDKKISKSDDKDLDYRPSPHLLSSLIKYQKRKFKIDDFSLEEMWMKDNLSVREYKNLNSFYWFFSLDLKSSKKACQMVISNWIGNNYRYNSKSWNFDLVSKRIIAWLSCHNLTYNHSDEGYKNIFNKIIKNKLTI